MKYNTNQIQEVQLHGLYLYDLNPAYTDEDMSQFFQRFAKTFFNSQLDGFDIMEQFKYNNFIRHDRLKLLGRRLVSFDTN